MGTTQSKTRLDSNSNVPAIIAGTQQQVIVNEKPTLRKIESFEEKLFRKFTEEPLVPIGCVVTAYFLGSGIRSFLRRDSVRSQKMMRFRVGSQMATILIFIGYAGYNNFVFNSPWDNNEKNEKKIYLYFNFVRSLSLVTFWDFV